VLLLLLQVLIDATFRPEFAVLDLAAGLSRPGDGVNADMPLDAARQHVYAITAWRVSLLTDDKRLYQGVIIRKACDDNWWTGSW